MTKLAMLGVSLALAACGKGDKGSSAPAVTIDVAAVNALVPASLKDKLVFEKRDVLEDRGRHGTTYTLAAPKDWTQEMKSFATLKPKDLGFMTSFSVGSNCDGTCEPKDWAKVSLSVNFAQFGTQYKIPKDERSKTDHMMIADDGEKVYVTYAWWTEGAKRYYTCSATLDKPVRDAAPAFEKACRAVSSSGDD